MSVESETKSHVICIVCDNPLDASVPEAYQALEHFTDACICHRCMELYHTGYPRGGQYDVKKSGGE